MHKSLEGFGLIAEADGHPQEPQRSKKHGQLRFSYVGLSYSNPVACPFGPIRLKIMKQESDEIRSCICRVGYLSWTTILLVLFGHLGAADCHLTKGSCTEKRPNDLLGAV